MRNQTSFRLTTTLLPTDTTAKTTTVINKVDSNGDKFYPTFTEETVVITNDDRTVMETTKAVCNNGLLTFTKRGLSDDASETPIENRKLTRNPGSLCFVTAGAGDMLDKDDDIIWTGKQTYTGDMESYGTATYRGELITQKGVKYPHFDNVAALEAYANPFGGMFAVVDSTGELYRYNAVTEERALIESSQPANPEMADDETIGTVRIATDAEFEAGTDTGSQGEKLVATPAQIKNITPSTELNVVHVNLESAKISTNGASASITYTILKAGFIKVRYLQSYGIGSDGNHDAVNKATVSYSGTATAVPMTANYPVKLANLEYRVQEIDMVEDIVAVGEGQLTITIATSGWSAFGDGTTVTLVDYIYFG